MRHHPAKRKQEPRVESVGFNDRGEESKLVEASLLSWHSSPLLRGNRATRCLNGRGSVLDLGSSRESRYADGGSLEALGCNLESTVGAAVLAPHNLVPLSRAGYVDSGFGGEWGWDFVDESGLGSGDGWE